MEGIVAFNDYIKESSYDKETQEFNPCTMMTYTLLSLATALFFVVSSFIWFMGPSAVAENTAKVAITDDKTPTEPARLLLESTDGKDVKLAIVPGADLDCSRNLTLVIITLVLMCLTFLMWCRPKTSLLTKGLIQLWMAFLCWSALASTQDECNTLKDSQAVQWFLVIAHFIWTFIALYCVSICISDTN